MGLQEWIRGVARDPCWIVLGTRWDCDIFKALMSENERSGPPSGGREAGQGSSESGSGAPAGAAASGDRVQGPGVAAGEGGSPGGAAPRKRMVNHCSICGEPGHRKQTCTADGSPPWPRGENRPRKARPKCVRCGKPGHYVQNCPDAPVRGYEPLLPGRPAAGPATAIPDGGVQVEIVDPSEAPLPRSVEPGSLSHMGSEPPLLESVASGSQTNIGVRNDKVAWQIRELAGVGVSIQSIARILEISVDNLVELYRKDFETGVDEANANVARSLYSKALGDSPQSVQACIFWLRSRARWDPGDQQQPKVEQPKASFDPSKLSSKGRELLRQLMQEASKTNQ